MSAASGQSEGTDIKKLSRKRKRYLDRHCLVDCARTPNVPQSRGRPSFDSRKPNVWQAPKEFNLIAEKQRRVLLIRLARLRSILWRGGAVCMDFSPLEKLFADGTLLFLAELRRLINHCPRPLAFTCVLPKNDKASQVLEQIGVFTLLKVAPGAHPLDEDVVNWRFAHGNQVEGKHYEDVLAEYDGAIAVPLQENLFAGMTEAMTNVINHAYDMQRFDGLDIVNSREWWMFSQSKDEYLTVAFLDLGAGIPRTLPIKRPSVWRRLLRMGRSEDSRAIAYAINDSISRTKLDYRGTGLGQILRAVDSVPGAEVVIQSNYGGIHRRLGATDRRDYADSILGTLIFWKVPLPNKEQS